MALSPKLKLSAAITRVVGVDANSSDPNKRGIAPYFGAVLRGLVRREMPDEMRAVFALRGLTPTLGVSEDGVLMWAPEFVSTFADDRITDLAYILVHEVMHIVLKHHERSRALGIVPDASEDFFAKTTVANMAQDACINEELEKLITLSGGKPPTDWVLPATLQQPNGLVFEERYRLLMKEVEKQRAANGGSKKVPPKPGKGWCGGCSGHPQPGEPQKSPDGRSQAEMDRFRRETASAVKDTASKSRGFVPDSLVRWAEEELAPAKIPWQEKLARVIRGAVAFRSGSADLTWNRPSRRQGGVGYGVGRPVMPSLHAPVPVVACALDVSGSMSSDLLAEALSEIQGVLRAVGAQVTLVICDAEVHGIKPIKTIQEAMKMMVGGGGTVLEPAIKAMADLKPKPSVAIILTDGYCDDPSSYGLDLIWTIVGGNTGFKPTNGDVIYVEKEAT
jgi:predicted metal-dependent peptidase